MDNVDQGLVERHFTDLEKLYPGLVLEKEQHKWNIRGLIIFSATYEGTRIQDSFHIELLIPDDYPKNPPTAKEIGGKIPPDFHKNSDESLCLALPVEVRRKFADNPSLLGFVNCLLIPYLFSFSYWKQHGIMPYGELSHGYTGVMEYYLDYFGVNSELVILRFLKILAADNYRGHHDCPCGSGRIIRCCHGSILLNLKKCQSQLYFLHDYLQCIEHMKNIGEDFSKSLPDKKSLELMKKCIRKNNNTEKRNMKRI